MARTPEQKAADEALTAAIEHAMDVYFDDGDDPGQLMDYTIIAARDGIDDDGDRWTSVVTLTRDDNVPGYIQIGLLDSRLSYLRGSIRSHNGEE